MRGTRGSGTTRQRHGTARRRRWLLGVLAAAVAIAGCSSGDGDQVAQEAVHDEAVTDGGRDDAAGAEADTGASGGTTAGSAPASAPADGDSASAQLPVGIGGGAFAGRDVIRTAELELRDDDTRALVEAIEATVDRLGGFVASAELAPAGEAQIRGRMTLRVRNERLDTALGELTALADEVGHRRLSTEDVTDQLTDLEAQLTNLRTLEAELRELLTEIRGGSSDAQGILAVFERLRDVRGEIERLEAHRAGLQERVALSTITVVVDPIAPTTTLAEPEPWRPGIVIEDALATTARALQTIADVAIWLVLTALPVAVVVLAPVAGAYVLWRRRSAGPVPS